MKFDFSGAVFVLRLYLWRIYRVLYSEVTWNTNFSVWFINLICSYWLQFLFWFIYRVSFFSWFNFWMCESFTCFTSQNYIKRHIFQNITLKSWGLIVWMMDHVIPKYRHAVPCPYLCLIIALGKGGLMLLGWCRENRGRQYVALYGRQRRNGALWADVSLQPITAPSPVFGLDWPRGPSFTRPSWRRMGSKWQILEVWSPRRRTWELVRNAVSQAPSQTPASEMLAWGPKFWVLVSPLGDSGAPSSLKTLVLMDPKERSRPLTPASWRIPA